MYNLNSTQEKVLQEIEQRLPEELKVKLKSILTTVFLYGYDKGARENGRRYGYNRRG